MEWRAFTESALELPEFTVESSIEGFEEATGGLAELGLNMKSEVHRLKSTDRLGTRFQFEVTLLSKYLPDYSFSVFEFGYNVSLYPVLIAVSKTIIESLVNRGERLETKMAFDNEQTFKGVLNLIFGSDRFNEVVSGLMKIAKKHRDNNPGAVFF